MASKLLIFLANVIEIYSYILLAWVVGSWFPQFTTTKFYEFITRLVYPYATIFRGLIPPMGGFDFSVIFAFMALYIMQVLLYNLAATVS